MDDSALHLGSHSLMVVDATALYDTAQRVGVTSFTDKRTGTEVLLLITYLSHHFALGLQRGATQRRFDQAVRETSTCRLRSNKGVETGPRPSGCRCQEKVVVPEGSERAISHVTPSKRSCASYMYTQCVCSQHTILTSTLPTSPSLHESVHIVSPVCLGQCLSCVNAALALFGQTMLFLVLGVSIAPCW